MTTNPELIEMMYWAEDEAWYTFDPKDNVGYHLTDAAPDRARIAYNKWLEHQIGSPDYSVTEYDAYVYDNIGKDTPELRAQAEQAQKEGL